MTKAVDGGLRVALAARCPESQAWLRLYDVAHSALDDAAWTAAVPAPSDTAPLIDGAAISADARAVTDLVRALLDRAGSPSPGDADVIALLEAAIMEDGDALHLIAARAGLPPEIAAATAALATMPLLQACRAAWGANIAEAWIDAACPVCGAWATMVEARGLERRLRHRCGRCGADWSAQPVRCGFCGAHDHAKLTTLVSERPGERGRVEACTACRGYVKTITTLTPCPPADVMLLDLDTVHLDVAAIEHGFQRPRPAPRRVKLEAAPRARARRRILRAALFGERR